MQMSAKAGLSWQIVPTILLELLKNGNSATSERVMKAMLQMRKIDVAAFKRVQSR